MVMKLRCDGEDFRCHPHHRLYVHRLLPINLCFLTHMLPKYHQNVGVNSFVNPIFLPKFGYGTVKTANYVDNFIKSKTPGAQWCPAP
ncbi:unnamed protein product [Darwinula stevensoni]|uniref:Uncharacterized protein n=1 Tax=Darwinula stevensoni TaxID=69355 RepID=A0A7R9A0I0_9CRUS|nr:unnamed protein product [Darwinula stevensoni]CAG0885613.1 unnamed protein product [Darwinula stevensoni]